MYKKRSKFSLDTETRGMIARKAVVHWMVFGLVSFVVFSVIEICSNPFAGPGDNTSNILRKFAPVLLTLACLGPVFVFDLVTLSKRIFGPIPRIRRTIRLMADGKSAKKLKARKNDIHSGLVADINLLIQLINNANTTSISDDSKTANVRLGDDLDKRSLADEHNELLSILREIKGNQESFLVQNQDAGASNAN